MITSNVIQRTLHIKRDNSEGTAFTLDHGGKQYLVTARHVVEGIASGERIFVVHEGQRKPVKIRVVGVGEGDVDVAVLACQQQLTPMHPLEPSEPKDFVYGQQVYFLGFPFGWNSGGEDINHGWPLPFVKAGIISAMSFSTPVDRIYIDAHVNKGFSGGPLVFSPLGRQNVLHVAGVVVGYPKLFQPVVDDHGNPVARVKENPGIVVAIGIQHVVALIESNPIGFALPASEGVPSTTSESTSGA